MKSATDIAAPTASSMKFQGDITSLPITDVAQNLSTNRKSGTLTLRRGPEIRRIVFQDGKIISYADNVGFSILHWLEEKGIINQDVLKKSFQKYKKTRRGNLGEILQQAGAMQPDQYRSHVKSLVEDVLYETFTFRDGSFEFQESQKDPTAMDPEITGLRLELAVGPILIESARRLDDWESIRKCLPSESDFYRISTGEKAEALRELAQDEVAVAAIKLLDGTRTIREVIAAIPSGRFDASRSIATLVTRKWAKPINGAELLTHLSSNHTPEDKSRALLQLKAGLEREPGNRLLLRKVAELTMEMGNREESALYHKLLALEFLDDGDQQGAEKELRQSIQLSPKDISAWQKLYDTLEAKGDHKALLTFGTQMAVHLRKMGLEEVARDHLVKMLERFPNQVNLRLEHAETLFALGNRSDAAHGLQELARDLLKKKHADDAERVLAKVLEYDRDNKRAREIYEELRSGKMARQRARRWHLIRGTSAVVFLWAFGLFVGYDLYARREFALTTRQVLAEGLIERGEYEKAVKRLEQVRDSHPLSLLGIVEAEVLKALDDAARRKGKR